MFIELNQDKEGRQLPILPKELPNGITLPPGISNIDRKKIIKDIGTAVNNKTDSCKSHEECGYPMYMCYQTGITQVDDTSVKISKCFITWWMILIIALFGLIFIVTIIVIIVVTCCKCCCM